MIIVVVVQAAVSLAVRFVQSEECSRVISADTREITLFTPLGGKEQHITRAQITSRITRRHEVEPVLLDFALGERQLRVEMPQQGAHSRTRDLPYTEETENVVQTIGIEIFAHLLQAAAPPVIPFGGHARPIVRRETPILPLGREGIGRSSRRHRDIEELGIAPYVHSRRGYAYRYISL